MFTSEAELATTHVSPLTYMNGEKTHARVGAHGAALPAALCARPPLPPPSTTASHLRRKLPQDALEFLVHDIAHMGARSPHPFNS